MNSEAFEGKINVVAIDGLCASGKSTAARNVANVLGFLHVNSGAIYRKIGLEAVKRGVDITDAQALVEVAKSLNMHFEKQNNQSLLIANDVPVGLEVATEESGYLASKVSVLPEVREIATAIQREAAKRYPVVLEGRDAGTVVFPNAPFKFFLDASIEVRTQRRLLELQKHSQRADLSSGAVRRDLEQRDFRDCNREVVPTKKAEDAVLIDTSELSAEAVFEKILSYIKKAN